jgi:hypothetical protein
MNVCSRSMRRGAERGQSLVETALFLPILIFLLAGVVEISNLLITQNRLLTASRMAAGFGATNYVREDWTQDGGTADDMGIVALNTVTHTMPLSPDVWDIYSIRALTNDEGTDFEEFESKHAFGSNVVITTTEWITIESFLRADILADLQSTGIESAKNVEVVASVPFHNLDDILGFNIWQWTGFQRASGRTVMRVLPEKEYGACPLLPISVRLKQFSIYPSNWAPGVSMHNIPGDPVDMFPEGSGPTNWEYPKPAPVYLNAGISASKQLTVTEASLQFKENDPGIPLEMAIADDVAHRGNLYWAREEGPGGNFGWLTWDGSPSANDLKTSLVIPGNFLEKYPGSPADTNTTGRPPQGIPGYDPPGTGDGDGWLEYHEWVENATGNIHSAVQVIDQYVDEDTYVNLVVFDMFNEEIPGVGPQSGANTAYRVYDFITVRLVGYSFQGKNDTKWILFEFISSGVTCGPGDS